MMRRLKNLWEMSRFSPKKTKEGVSLEETISKTPKGQAQVITLEEPISQFPDEKEI